MDDQNHHHPRLHHIHISWAVLFSFWDGISEHALCVVAVLSFNPGDDHEDVVDVGDVEDGGDHHLCLAQAQPELLIVIQLVATC